MDDEVRWKWLLIGGTTAVAVGALLPWASVSAGFVTATKAGTDGDGVFTLLLSLVVGGLALAKWKAGLGRGVLITALVLGLLLLAVAVIDTVDVATTSEETELVKVEASVGIGLWLTLLGSIAMVIGAIWALRTSKQPDVALAPAAWGAPPDPAQYMPPPPPTGGHPIPPSSPPASTPPPSSSPPRPGSPF